MPMPPETTWLTIFSIDGLTNRKGTPGALTLDLIGSEQSGDIILHNATTDESILTTTQSLILSTQGITIGLGYEKTDSTNRASGAIGVKGEGLDERCGVHLPFSDGIVYWDFGGVTEDSTRESVSGLSVTGYHTWAFTSGARGMEIWQDGVLRSSNAANPTRVNSGPGNYSLGRHGDGVPAESDLAEYTWVYVGTAQMSTADITEMLTNTITFFADPPASSVTITNYPGWIGRIMR